MPNYYPLLRWKQGKQAALQHLTPAVKKQFDSGIDR